MAPATGGFAVTTTYEFVMGEWSDDFDDYPLTYAFGYVDAGRDSTHHSNTTHHEGDSQQKDSLDSLDSDGGNRAWMRAVVDMYVASLADADVQLPGSSFMNAGDNRLSVTNERKNSLGFGGEVVMDQAVTPIGETEERSAGFQKNYENYVLLSASHCEFDDE